MQLVFLHGYPDYVGKRFIWAAVGTPPVALPATGDPIVLPRFGNYIDTCVVGQSVSGGFQGRATPNVAGARANWTIKYTFNTVGSANTSINAAGSGQTPGNYPITFNGTVGTGGKAASGYATVGAGGTITSLTVFPGYGYTTAPTTATITGSGGTPGTLTVAASTIGAQVPAGANLSTETFQTSGFGGVY